MLNLAILTTYINATKKEKNTTTKIFMKKFFYKEDINLVRVSIDYFNEKKQLFEKYFDIRNDGEIIEKDEYLKPDFIWIRTKNANFYNFFLLRNFIKFPNFDIIELCRNKYEMYLMLKEFMPKSILLEDFFYLKGKGFSDDIVLKPINNNGGEGIKFLKKNDLLKKGDDYEGLTNCFIVQEYKDFSKGYNGLVNGVHDLRLTFVGNDFSFSIIRNPKKGDFKSNIGAGGTKFNLTKESIPTKVISISEKIKKVLGTKENDVYSLDFAYCKYENQRYLLEINSSPGLTVTDNKNITSQEKYLTDLSNMFKKYKF